MFSEKASAIARMRQKCVRNASKCGKEERSKMRQKCVKIASEMRQKCAEHLWGRTPFGRYRKWGGGGWRPFPSLQKKMALKESVLIVWKEGKGRHPHTFSRFVLTLRTLTSLNKEARPFFLSDTSIWSLPSVSSLSDYSIRRSWRLF